MVGDSLLLRPRVSPLHSSDSDVSFIVDRKPETRRIEGDGRKGRPILEWKSVPVITTKQDIVFLVGERIGPLRDFESLSRGSLVHEIFHGLPNVFLRKFQVPETSSLSTSRVTPLVG